MMFQEDDLFESPDEGPIDASAPGAPCDKTLLREERLKLLAEKKASAHRYRSFPSSAEVVSFNDVAALNDMVQRHAQAQKEANFKVADLSTATHVGGNPCWEADRFY